MQYICSAFIHATSSVERKINFSTATSVVIANMVGTGVFTSLGFQLFGINDFATLMFLWLLGGIISLFGAFAYAELGAALPKSGGEYNFLSKIFHPSIGFLSGWISATIGFAAPIALAASALAKYTNTVFSIDEKLLGVGIILLITIFQSVNYKIGGTFQTIVTSLKVLLIAVFIIAGLFFTKSEAGISFLPTDMTFTKAGIFSAAFATSMFYVAFAYSGWNASSYIAGEIINPKRNIPRSLFMGTAIVTVLYVLVNFVFLKTTPVDEMRGQVEVGFVSGNYIFGADGAKVVSMIISLLLVSTISAMVIAGPRVISAIGNDFSVFKIAAKTNKSGIPVIAIWLQSAIAIALLLTGSFSTILNYTTFVLILFGTLTVAGVIVLRMKNPNLERPYKCWGYPITPLLFIIPNCWFLFYALKSDKDAYANWQFWFEDFSKVPPTFIGILIVLVGALVYLFAKNFSTPNSTKN